jgi:uncharacterized membrane protein
MMCKGRLSIVVLILFMTFLVPVQAQQPVTPESLSLTVYVDGAVYVEYGLSVDPTYPVVNVSLFGQVFEDLLVVDENGDPLGYSLDGGVLTVDTLGASFMKVSYTTYDLTNKIGRYWSLNLSVPVATTVILPPEASILSLNVVPVSIDSGDGYVLLLMPAGQVEVTYSIGIVGTREYALVMISEAEKKIEEVKGYGIIVTEAEALLSQAKEAFDKRNYAQAEELAGKAKNLALQINEVAGQASAMIDEAEKAIEKAEGEGRTLGLEEAKGFLSQAKDEFNLGNYQQALDLATQAKAKADEAVSAPVTKPAEFPYLEIIVGVVGIAIIGVALYKLSRRPPKYVKEVHEVDLDKIFGEKADLRLEDREAIQFLAEAGGEAFESEIRERFKLPRTTVWRMIKRLEREEIVEIRKVGGQNLIKIRPEYYK